MSRPAPGVSDGLGMGTPVVVLQNRVSLLRIEIGRLDQRRFEDEAVRRGDLEELHPSQMESLDIRYRILVNRPNAAAIGSMERNLRWRLDVAPGVQVVVELGVERGSVGPALGAEALEVQSVQTLPVEVNLDRTVLAGGEIDPSRVLVYAVELAHFPFAIGNLPQQLSRRIEMVEVMVAGPSGGPKKRSVLQPVGCPGQVDIDKSRTGLMHQCPGLTSTRLSQVDVEPGLFAVLDQKDDLTAVECPPDANNEMVFRLIPGRVRPDGGASADRHDPQSHVWVGVTGLWVVHDFGAGSSRQVIDQRELVHW